MAKSKLATFTRISPHKNSPRNMPIDRITPHCVVGQASATRIGEIFAEPKKKASCNYGIGYDGKIICVVDENDRSWCSSSEDNDQRAITVEIASDNEKPYAMKDKAYNAFIDLCVDICERHGKTKLIWFANKKTTLAYEPKKNEMVLTVHRWFAAKSCPGEWLYSRLGDVAATVTTRLSKKKTIYRVQVGAYSSKTKANKMLKRVKAAGFTDAIIKESEV